jgi:hypothetical protein
LAANLKDSDEENADKKIIPLNLPQNRPALESNKFYFMEFIIIFEPFGSS